MSADSAAPTQDPPFWRTKPLTAMTRPEWESLCDHCGRCCLHKIEDADTGQVLYTEVACRMLDLGSCGCSDYAGRQRHVPDCVELTPEFVKELTWLPSTCAYRLLSEGRALAWWHPLESGDPDTVHRAGISVRGRVVPESRAELLDYHVVSWPE